MATSEATTMDRPFGFSTSATTPPPVDSHLEADDPFSKTIGVLCEEEEEEFMRHLQLLGLSGKAPSINPTDNAGLEEVRNAPLFTRSVRSAINNNQVEIGQHDVANFEVFPQYGLIGHRQSLENGNHNTSEKENHPHNVIYANMNAPWSAFICGSQGAGKSHTFSCLLENALLSPNPGGILPDPLSGIVFHYDKFTSHSSAQLCEAAYLCSSGIPVRVLVSPTNYHSMNNIYSNLPGLPKDAPRPVVWPLMLRESHLNVAIMKTLMCVGADPTNPPLYLAVLDKILRDMAKERKGRPGFDYTEFKKRLSLQGFTEAQMSPLYLRLQLLEEFLDQTKAGASRNIWDIEKGTLTIVDLSCPFVQDNDACALFSISLTLFLEQRSSSGRIIALDEAHKFLTRSGEAELFTEQLISVIRQQRHLACRVVIATQEPTLSPVLLDLCNVTFVHRFRSPQWLDAIKDHLAGAATLKKRDRKDSTAELFEAIVSLKTGEALLFSPDALLEVRGAVWNGETDADADAGTALAITAASTASPRVSPLLTIHSLLNNYIKLRIRARLTADGGKSIMASDKSQSDSAMVMEPDALTAAQLVPQPIIARRTKLGGQKPKNGGFGFAL